jgi:hypothetical protein
MDKGDKRTDKGDKRTDKGYKRMDKGDKRMHKNTRKQIKQEDTVGPAEQFCHRSSDGYKNTKRIYCIQ